MVCFNFGLFVFLVPDIPWRLLFVLGTRIARVGGIDQLLLILVKCGNGLNVLLSVSRDYEKANSVALKKTTMTK